MVSVNAKEMIGLSIGDQIAVNLPDGTELAFTCLLYTSIGENGAGKTTLLTIICGYSKQSAGQVQSKGKNIVANPLITREFGVLIEPQFLDYISAVSYTHLTKTTCFSNNRI